MNNSKIRMCVSWLLSCALAAPLARAGVIWDESIHGELADLNRFGHPDPAQRGTFTDLGPLTPGVNTIRGTCLRASSTITDGDAIRFTIPADMTLTEIIFSHTSIAGLREFFRFNTVAPGPYFLSRTYPAASLPLGTQDLMQIYGPADGLGGGSYVLSWENLGLVGSTMTYTMDLVVVPAPGAAGAAVAAAFAGTWRRRRSRAHRHDDGPSSSGPIPV
jgi:hypothetical protein